MNFFKTFILSAFFSAFTLAFPVQVKTSLDHPNHISIQTNGRFSLGALLAEGDLFYSRTLSAGWDLAAGLKTQWALTTPYSALIPTLGIRYLGSLSDQFYLGGFLTVHSRFILGAIQPWDAPYFIVAPILTWQPSSPLSFWLVPKAFLMPGQAYGKFTGGLELGTAWSFGAWSLFFTTQLAGLDAKDENLLKASLGLLWDF